MCRKVNPRLLIKRARFSALTEGEVARALGPMLGSVDLNAAAAVNLRQEIDLRLGSAFTRFQTTALQHSFEWGEFCGEGGKTPLISYGPCQFPTLGFITQRYWEHKSFTPSPHWWIDMSHRAAGGASAQFAWARGRLAAERPAAALYQLLVAAPTATVLSAEGRESRRFPPAPLNTLEMQKRACRVLRVSPETVMQLAEELYQQGYISYPRTETDAYPAELDLKDIVGA